MKAIDLLASLATAIVIGVAFSALTLAIDNHNRINALVEAREVTP